MGARRRRDAMRWMREFGPIDVGCRIEIDRVGLANGSAGPRLTLVFNDGTSTLWTQRTYITS